MRRMMSPYCRSLRIAAGFTVLLGAISVRASDPPEANTPVASAFSEQAPGLKATSAAPPKLDAAKVSATGAIGYQIQVRIPPGRNGAEPSIGLSYSSARANDASAFGAGWSYSASRIARSSKHGTPRIRQVNGVYAYDDSDGDYPTFERDGTELVALATKPSGGTTYADRIDNSRTRSIYYAGTPSYWNVTDRNGNTRYFGAVPDGSVPEAVIRDDLGTREWLLVRSADPFGNTVDYTYIAGPPRSDLSAAQLAPLPYQIKYGANLNTGMAHSSLVEFTYQPWQGLPGQPQRYLYDHERGHLYLDRVLQRIDVSLLKPQITPIRTYNFTIQASPSTSRPILTKMQETAGGLNAPAQSFEYTQNDGGAYTLCPSCAKHLIGFDPSPTLSASIFKSVFRLFGGISGPLNNAPYSNLFDPPTDDNNDGVDKWPSAFLDINRLTAREHYASPPGISSAFQFQDLDGDGTSDILYHPRYLAGFGVAQPWISYLQAGGHFDKTQSFDQVFAGKKDPLSTRDGATTYTDVDNDGVADRILLTPNLDTSGEDNQTTTNPSYAGICAFWFSTPNGGAIDPIPDQMTILVAAFELNEAANALGVRGPEWSVLLNQTMQGLLNESHGLPLDGGIPNGLENCYHWGASNPLGDPSLSDYLSGKDPRVRQFVGQFTVEHGRLTAPDEMPHVVTSTLSHYPNVGWPEFKFQVKPQTQGVVFTGARNVREVDTSMLDLDASGAPELVIIKSVAGGDDPKEKWDPGVWRLHDLAATHELDEPSTATRFVPSLKSILLTRHTVTGFSWGNLITQWQCSGSSAVPPAALFGTALRNQVLLQVRSIDLAEKQRQVLNKYIDRFLAPKAALGKWVSDRTGVGIQTQKFLPDDDWVSTFIDVNGDGLPDLVLSKGATCHDTAQPARGSSSAPPDHHPGFEVYLNRGDRFETSAAPGEPYAHGPFDLVRNWNAGLDASAMTDRERFPFGTLAFADIDGNGTIDAVLAVQVNVIGSSSPQWSRDTTACANELSLGNKILVRCVWLGTGASWLPSRRIAATLPSDNGIHSWVTWQPGGGAFGSFAELNRTDLARFVDFDNDGLPDIITVRDFTPGGITPDQDPTRILRNTGTKPDVLQAIDNGIGGRITVVYGPAQRNEIARAPTVPWVVRRVDRTPQADDSDQVATDSTHYVYANGQYDYREREFLGFETLTETHPVPGADNPGSSGTPALVMTRTFYMAEPAVCGVANPRAGQQKSTVKMSLPDGLVQTTLDETATEIVPVCAEHRVRSRPTLTHSVTCKGVGCLAGNGGRMDVKRQSMNFDDYDNAALVTTVASRNGFVDGFDGTVSFNNNYSFINDTNSWILGLPKTYTRTSNGTTLASQAFQYVRNKLSTKSADRLRTSAICPATFKQFTEHWIYNPDGTIAQSSNNNDQATGSPPSNRTYEYDNETAIYALSQTDHYTLKGAPATLVRRLTYDRRFGTVQTITDANGNTTQQLRDALGRMDSEVGADGQTVRTFAYQWNARPIQATTTSIPAHNQPNIVSISFLDGYGRVRQSETVVGTDAFVDQWNTYTPNGALFEESLPFKVSSEAFIPRSLFSRPLTHHEVDVLGRVVLTKAADGRDTRSRYAPQSIISFDARGTPSTSYVDALDRVIGVDESYRPAGSSDNYARERTTYLLDADGRVLSTTDADGNSRSLAYDQNGDVVSAQPFHKPGAVPSPYEYCFDGLGHELVSLSPSGVKVTSKLDSLGRAIERHYLPAAKFGGDDETYVYDDPLTPNGLGRLTASSNSRASISVDYDARGNVSQRTVKTMLGAAALPFTDGTFVSKMQFDALDRVIGEKPPWDPAQMDAPLALAYDYDERGNAKSIRQGSATLATVAPFSPSGKPLRDDLANGLTESYAYDPLNDRFTSSTVRHGTDPAILSYTVSYDAADNPKNVVRFWGTGLGSSDTLTKTFAFDSLNRLATASITGLAATAQQYQYAYSPAGNIRSKDGYSYVYGGDDPQAVTARTSPVTNANEHYGYDADGQLHTASPGHDGRQTTFGWDGAGRLVSASGVSAAGTVSSAFRYGPDGARLARSITGAHPASDIYIGSLELRHEGAGNTRRGYFNVAFGPVHLQLALKPGASGRLEADPTANRFYHLDYLGSTALVTSPAGTIVSNSGSAGRLEYAPYGEALATDDGAKTIRTRYTGKELDDETQLTYFGARYADLTLGRWISRDPLFISDAGPSARRPGSGLFTFVGGNPIARTDPDGRQECRSCDVASDSAAGGKFAKINAQASLKGAEINAIASGWLLFGLANPTGAMLSAVGLSQTSGASDAEGAALLGGLLLGKLAGVVGRTLSREVPAVTSAVAEGTAGTTAGARFAVTPKGVSVPTNPAELETSMQVLQETSTKPDVARKFVGADMRGNPVRVRIEKAHPEVPGYTGPKDPLHTVDHLHIDRRANGATGSWDSDEKLKYDWPF